MFGSIKIRGARENNLKNVSLDIPSARARPWQVTYFRDEASRGLIAALSRSLELGRL
jgi:hypothetical protein